jgi:hypothetical protein
MSVPLIDDASKEYARPTNDSRVHFQLYLSETLRGHPQGADAAVAIP